MPQKVGGFLNQFIYPINTVLQSSASRRRVVWLDCLPRGPTDGKSSLYQPIPACTQYLIEYSICTSSCTNPAVQIHLYKSSSPKPLFWGAAQFTIFQRISDRVVVQGLAVWRGAQARCDFAEALRFPAVLQCGAQQILQILLPSDGLLNKVVRNCRSQSKYLQ